MAPLGHEGSGRARAAGATLADHGAPTAAAAQRGRWSWLRRPTVQGLLALLIYIAVWLSIPPGRDIVSRIGDAHLDQFSQDPNFYVWSLRWWPWAIAHGQNPLFSSLVNAPDGASLAWVTTVPPLALLATPLTLTIGPVATLNLLTALGPPVAGWAAFVLCRRLTAKFWPSLVGGSVYGFSAYELNHVTAGQLNLVWSLLIPIAAYLVLLWRDEAIGSRSLVILLGVTLALQFYLFLETFAELTGLLVIALIIGVAVAGREHRPFVRRLARNIGLAYLLGAVLALPFVLSIAGTPAGTQRVLNDMDVATLVVPRPDNMPAIRWMQAIAVGGTTTGAYVGIPLLAVAICLAVTRWSSRLVRLLTFMLIFVIVAALGPYLYFEGGQVTRLPWASLWELPIASSAFPSRLMLFAFLILAVATSIWLSGATKLWLRVPLALLVVYSLIQDVPYFQFSSSNTVPAYVLDGSYVRQLARGETVVVVSDIGNAGMAWQAVTDFHTKLAGGYINQRVSYSAMPTPVAALRRATPAVVLAFEAYLKEDHIGAILVDVNNAPPWAPILQRIGLPAQRTGDVIVYQVNDCATCRVLSWADIGVQA